MTKKMNNISLIRYVIIEIVRFTSNSLHEETFLRLIFHFKTEQLRFRLYKLVQQRSRDPILDQKNKTSRQVTPLGVIKVSKKTPLDRSL